MVDRILDLSKVKGSIFLLGPRQTGKTYLCNSTLKPDLFINLLIDEDYLRYAKNSSLLIYEVLSIKGEIATIVIDEIQRLPTLLNSVHYLIEERPAFRFILTGSSARKLRKGGTNLLGGRAITLHLHPFSYNEIKDNYNTNDILKYGLIPRIFLEKNVETKIQLLKSYCETYLKEEIKEEALTRNIPAFARFLELAGFENGNLLNFQNIAREVGVHSSTIKEYFTILEDTLLGFFIYPFTKSHRKKLIAHPKFYFFDTGVVNALKGRASVELIEGTRDYGYLFEHFIILELIRSKDYYNHDFKISFFRTQDGAEVDLILEFYNEIWAIEIKSSMVPRDAELRGLKSFISDHKINRAICVSKTPRKFKKNGIEFFPWEEFLESLIK